MSQRVIVTPDENGLLPAVRMADTAGSIFATVRTSDDIQTTWSSLQVAAVQVMWDGANYIRQRIATKNKFTNIPFVGATPLNNTAITAATAGKKQRLLGLFISSDQNVTVTIKDNNATIVMVANIGANSPTNINFSQANNGFLAGAVTTAFTVDVSGVTTGTVAITTFTNEE